jgi:uncharacterized protein YegL
MKVIKEETPEVKKTFVTFLLDDSGSMKGVVNETILGFNDQLRAVQKMEEEPNHEVYVSFILFSDSFKIQTIRRFERASQVRPLTKEDYDARGGFTALLDGMYRAILVTEEKAIEISQGKNAALVIFVTDGGENASRSYNKAQVKEKIQALSTSDRWTFTFMGTESIDSVHDNYGIAYGNVTQFQHGKAGMHSNSIANSASIGAYANLRSSGGTFSASFYDTPATPVAPAENVTPTVVQTVDTTDTTSNQ